MPIVSDSSGLILFAAIGHLELLRQLFKEVHIPIEVWDEVVSAGRNRPGAEEVPSAPWIDVRWSSGSTGANLGDLGRGEAAAIRLAITSRPSDGLLLDDLEGRRAARILGLRVTGSCGVLLLAKRRKVVSQVRPLLWQLRDAGLFLSDSLAKDILDRAGES